MGRGTMLGRAADRHGSCCGGPPGIDCADYYKGKKAQRAYEKLQWKREELLCVELITQYWSSSIPAGSLCGRYP